MSAANAPHAAMVLHAATAQLTAADIPNAPRDTRLLLAHAMEVPADRLTLHLSDLLDSEAATRFHSYIARRLTREPVSQIIGHRLFWGRSFRVSKDTLDPRPETEGLVAEALRLPFHKMLDLGTGTGCILLSCLADRPNATGIGTDLSSAALEMARMNADHLDLTQRTSFLQSNWCDAVEGLFDLITCNPPYIAADEMSGLSPEVLNHEPHLALSPGGDGLDAYRILARQAGGHLAANGRLLLEIGPTQAAAVSALLAANGFTGITVLDDLDNRPRVVCATNTPQIHAKIGA